MQKTLPSIPHVSFCVCPDFEAESAVFPNFSVLGAEKHQSSVDGRRET